jgi:hypothetical protein
LAVRSLNSATKATEKAEKHATKLEKAEKHVLDALIPLEERAQTAAEDARVANDVIQKAVAESNAALERKVQASKNGQASLNLVAAYENAQARVVDAAKKSKAAAKKAKRARVLADKPRDDIVAKTSCSHGATAEPEDKRIIRCVNQTYIEGWLLDGTRFRFAGEFYFSSKPHTGSEIELQLRNAVMQLTMCRMHVKMIVLDGGTGNCQFIRSVRQSGGNSMLSHKDELGIEDCSLSNWAEPDHLIYIAHCGAHGELN